MFKHSKLLWIIDNVVNSFIAIWTNELYRHRVPLKGSLSLILCFLCFFCYWESNRYPYIGFIYIYKKTIKRLHPKWCWRQHGHISVWSCEIRAPSRPYQICRLQPACPPHPFLRDSARYHWYQKIILIQLLGRGEVTSSWYIFPSRAFRMHKFSPTFIIAKIGDDVF